VAAIKTGMLANADVVRAVARVLKALSSPIPALVIDPVCVSTSGHTLLERDALGALVTELLPLATVLTPNASEAALLLQQHSAEADTDAPASSLHLSSIEDMLRASRALCLLGPRAVLLKGGHVARGAIRLSDVEAAATGAASGSLRVDRVEYDGMVRRNANMEILFRASATAQDPAKRPDDNDDDNDNLDVPVIVDVLCEVDAGDNRGGGSGEDACFTLFVKPYLDSTSTHGTGCTLGAALACALARGQPRRLFVSLCLLVLRRQFFFSLRHVAPSVVKAVAFATIYTHHGIATAFPMGNGHGPLNHMHSLLSRALHR
jgi:hydroxymethylpyrimidine/phosphomethylpyrimidine kinase / thiaminase